MLIDKIYYIHAISTSASAMKKTKRKTEQNMENIGVGFHHSTTIQKAASELKDEEQHVITALISNQTEYKYILLKLLSTSVKFNYTFVK